MAELLGGPDATIPADRPGLPAELLQALTSSAPPGARSLTRLRRLRRGAGAMERNLAAAPVFAPRAAQQLELPGVWTTAGQLHRQQVRVLAPHGLLTVHDVQLLLEVVGRLIRDECRATGCGRRACGLHRRVTASMAELARAMGRSGAGGRDLEEVTRSLERLKVTAFDLAVRVPGQDRTHRLMFSIVDWWTHPTRTGRGAVATLGLSEPFVALLRSGSVVYLDRPTLGALASRDTVAALLWKFLEAERLPGPSSSAWRYPLFETDGPAWSPALAYVCGLDANARRHVRARIARAAAVIEELDPRYAGLLRVTPMRAGKALLEARRNTGVRVRKHGGSRTETRGFTDAGSTPTTRITGLTTAPRAGAQENTLDRLIEAGLSPEVQAIIRARRGAR